MWSREDLQGVMVTFPVEDERETNYLILCGLHSQKDKGPNMLFFIWPFWKGLRKNDSSSAVIW